MTGCTTGGSDPREMTVSAAQGCAEGCLLFSASRTVGELGVSGDTRSSGNRTRPLLFSVMRRMAAFVLPWNMRLEKERANRESVSEDRLAVYNLCCMDRPSNNSSSIFPSFRNSMRRVRCVVFSLGLDLKCGCCKRRTQATLTAFRAMISRAELSA